MRTPHMRKRIRRRLFPPRRSASKRSQPNEQRHARERRSKEGKENEKKDGSISRLDILNIYTDVSKLSAIENYLNILYRPFTCFVRTQCEYRLAELNCCLAQTCYEPSKHSALIIRHASPSCRLKVYDNGNISCQGYSYESAAQGIQCFIGTVEKLGYTPVFHSPRFNVVNATFSMPFDINLKQLYRNYCDECLYNAETHPYLIFNVSKWSIKLAIFTMGYVCVLLASQPTATHKAIAFILPILFGHRMTSRSSSGQQEEEQEPKLQSGDITFKLLWENEFQKAYQDTLKCVR